MNKQIINIYIDVLKYKYKIIRKADITNRKFFCIVVSDKNDTLYKKYYYLR